MKSAEEPQKLRFSTTTAVRAPVNRKSASGKNQLLAQHLFTQVASKPDLDDDANWIEIKWPTRKEPNRTVANKVLFFGGRQNTRIKEATRDQVSQNLKTSLSQKRALNTQDDHCSSVDESPQRIHGGKRAKINKAVRSVLLPLASSPSSDDATYIGSPQRHDIDHASDEELDFSSAQRTRQTDDNNNYGMAHGMNEIMSALCDLPEIIKLMKESVECVQALRSSIGGTPPSAISSSSVESEIEMHPLAGSTVKVPKRAFLQLNRCRMTIFAQELAVLVFTKEDLAQSTLLESLGQGGCQKYNQCWV